jgi:hypothetical protein
MATDKGFSVREANKRRVGRRPPTHAEIAVATNEYESRGRKIRKMKAIEGRRLSINPAPPVHGPAYLPEGGQQVHREDEPEEE